MDDEDRFALQQEYEATTIREYRRGLRLSKKNPTKELIENCPWCNALGTYRFDNVSSWICLKCEYTPGADLFGGRYS